MLLTGSAGELTHSRCDNQWVVAWVEIFSFFLLKSFCCPSSSGLQLVTDHFHATGGKTEAQ